ncbi:MAG: acetolactate synthase small subunit [Fervidicoccaceae archaeon]
MNGRDSSSKAIVAVVEDRPGVLYRVSSSIRRRGINIDSMNVSPIGNSGFSKMVFIVRAEEETAEHLVKSIAKTPSVLSVELLELGESVVRELALLKVAVHGKRREVVEVLRRCDAKVLIDEGETLIAEVVGAPEELNAVVELLDSLAVLLDVSRSGPLALRR